MTVRELSGTTAIITGASRGFGRATAVALVGRGAHVVGVARSEQGLDQLRQEHGSRFDFELADAADPSLPERLFARHQPQIVVLNAGKVRVTGRKLTDKIYYHHTGYIGGIKSIALQKLLDEHPERAIQFAVKGMLPKNPLGRRMFRKLHVFAGGEHPHQAQQPRPLEI